MSRSESEADADAGNPLVPLICGTCPFHKESDADLECGAFVILKRLLEAGTISPGDIDRVLGR